MPLVNSHNNNNEGLYHLHFNDKETKKSCKYDIGHNKQFCEN